MRPGRRVLPIAAALFCCSSAALPSATNRQATVPEKRIVKVRIVNATAAYVAEKLRAMSAYKPSEVTLEVIEKENLIVASGTEEAVKDLQEVVRMLDIRRKQVAIKAELVLLATAPEGRVDRRVLSSPMVMTFNDSDAHITLGTTGYVPGKPGEQSRLTVRPRLHNDGAITMIVSWTGDLLVRFTPKGEPIRVRQTASGTVKTPDAKTVIFTGSFVKRGDGEPDAQVLLFLTPSEEKGH
jgi:hypothetical protein